MLCNLIYSPLHFCQVNQTSSSVFIFWHIFRDQWLLLPIQPSTLEQQKLTFTSQFWEVKSDTFILGFDTICTIEELKIIICTINSYQLFLAVYDESSMIIHISLLFLFGGILIVFRHLYNGDELLKYPESDSEWFYEFL